ncbi:MAG: TIGR01459 family HAD-type hydrolase [Candidatus Fonsibacter ubiquis]|nr:TIGR01459 family HAD-type hydrolase [Candidatus Fonsibacter ubiquis]
MNNPVFLSGLSKIYPKFDIFFVDLWGVIHNGIECYSEALKVLKNLKKTKKIILISNAPRPSSSVQKFLNQINFNKNFYHFLITSGDLTRYYLKNFSKNENFYHLGPDRDNSLFFNLTLKKTSLKNANFVICTGVNNNNDNLNKYFSILKKIKKRNLKIICANPDLIVHRGDRAEYCAGSIAKLYEKMGGNVEYFGKPYRNIYEYVFRILKKNSKKKIHKSKVLVIGDNLNTDISGANNFNVKNLFIAGGIHKPEWSKKNISLANFVIEKNKYFKINYFQNELIW